MKYEIVNLYGRYAVRRTKKVLFFTFIDWLNFERYERTASFLWFSSGSLFEFDTFTTDELSAKSAVNNIICIFGGKMK